MRDVFYYSDGAGARRGPVSRGVMRDLAARGEIRGTTDVWREGMSEPVPAHRMTVLFPQGTFDAAEVRRAERRARVDPEAIPVGAGSGLHGLGFVRAEIEAIPELARDRPGAFQGLDGFLRRAGAAARLILEEKEIVVFALLQWAVIAFAYYLWVQMLSWIPDSVWRQAAEHRRAGPADLVMFLWSLVCVALAALPLGVLNAAIAAAHLLRSRGDRSTVGACLQIACRRAWPLWVFHAIDGWLTVRRILDRLPKRGRSGTAIGFAAREALHYAWKLGTIGILPALVAGRGLVDAGRHSVCLVKERLFEAATLRVGYSALCWIIGVGTYVLCILAFAAHPDLLRGADGDLSVPRFYAWAGLPMLVGLAILQVFVRPLYVLSSCALYTEFLADRDERVEIPKGPSQLLGVLIGILVLCVLAAAIAVLSDALGASDLMSRDPVGGEAVDAWGGWAAPPSPR